MNLLKYVEEMKNLPERFSNLSFWRGCRRFKDSVVNALEYVDSWGDNIENTVDEHTHDIDDLNLKVLQPTKYQGTDNGGLYKSSSPCNWITIEKFNGMSVYNCLSFTNGSSVIYIDDSYLEKCTNMIPFLDFGGNKLLINCNGIFQIELKHESSHTTTAVITPNGALYSGGYKLLIGDLPASVPVYVGVFLQLHY